jgi:hypothetical protein
MSNIDTGGPAFPCEEQTNWTDPGMTLRDYFAAKAMQGLMAHDRVPLDWPEEVIADSAYRQADAMLKARTE